MKGMSDLFVAAKLSRNKVSDAKEGIHRLRQTSPFDSPFGFAQGFG